MKFSFLISSLVISVLTITSCVKTDEPNYTDFVQTAQDEALAESFFEDANQESDKQHENTEDGSLKAADIEGPTVTIDSGENGFADSTWSITVDFGTGLIGRNAWERKGKIIIDVYGRYKDKGSYRTVTFDNYYVNDYKVEGTHTAENLGFDSVENCMIFTINVKNGLITTPENKTISWESTRTRKWVAGFETGGLQIFDDEYEITGEAHGTNSKGMAYTKTIIEPLHVNVGCQYIQSGKLQIELEEKKDIQIDYSYTEDETAACDDKAKLEVNGNSYPFKMRK